MRARLANWEKAGLAMALLALVVVLQLARIGWTASLNSLWAEDGSIYLHGALTQGFFSAVGTEYSGYLVLIPRLLAEIGSIFPLRDAPAAMAIASAVLIGLSGFVVWRASAGHIGNAYLRGGLALLTVLTAVGGTEVIVSAANVPWFMLVAAFWLLLWSPRSDWGAGLGGVFIALTALSTPGTLFFLPLAILRALAVRNRRDLMIVGAYFGANLIQVIAMAHSTYNAIEPVWTSDIWTVLLQRVVVGVPFGLRAGGALWEHLGWPFLIVVTVCVVAALAAGFARTSRSVRCLAALAIPIALVMFVASVYQRAVGTPMLWPTDGWIGDAGRYSLVPVMLLVSVVLAMVDTTWRGRAWRERPRLGIAIASLLVLSALVSLPARNLTGRGTPPWSASLDKAEKSCAVRPDSEPTFDISPPGFVFSLPCSVVAPSGSDRRR